MEAPGTKCNQHGPVSCSRLQVECSWFLVKNMDFILVTGTQLLGETWAVSPTRHCKNPAPGRHLQGGHTQWAPEGVAVKGSERRAGISPAARTGPAQPGQIQVAACKALSAVSWEDGATQGFSEKP